MVRTFVALTLCFSFTLVAAGADETKAEKKKKDALVIKQFGKEATPETLFAKLDADKDGKLTAEELKKIGESTKKPEKFKADTVVPMLMEKLDADKDGKLTADEFKKLAELKVEAKK